MSEFKSRVFGCVIVKAINSNYNADFTHQPRTLPDGIVYATDKALKFSIRHYLKEQYSKEIIFFYKNLNEELVPRTLSESYENVFGELKKEEKNKVLTNLLGCLDVRFFGATFAAKGKGVTVNLSIHGPVQINHGVNRFPKNEIYSEQIMSPFRNPGKEDEEAKGMTTLGQQSKLREGHYVHHFSVNPRNLYPLKSAASEIPLLTDEDIKKLKEAMTTGVTYYDSTSKAGSENEMLVWIELKEESKLVLPVLTEMIKVERENDMVYIDFNNLTELLNSVSEHVSSLEIHYSPETTKLENEPKNAQYFHLVNGKKIQS